MAPTESLQVATYHAEYHLKIYAPQLVTAARTLADHPSSKIAKENLEGKLCFCPFIERFWNTYYFFHDVFEPQ